MENKAKKTKAPGEEEQIKEELTEMKDVYQFKRAQKVKLLFAHHCNI